MNSSAINLYDAHNIETFIWPDNPESQELKKFLLPLIRNGLRYYVDNIETRLFLLSLDNLLIPITVNEAEYNNSYVCSPYGQFITYGMEFAETLKFKPFRFSLYGILTLLSKFFSWGEINKVVSVNNWPFSINIHPTLSERQLESITHFLKKRFPKHTIMFRSIYRYQNDTLFTQLRSQSYRLIAGRQVYFLDPQEEVYSTRILKSDLKLFRDSKYEVVDDKETLVAEAEKILSMYRSIYLDKHSKLNMQFNLQFIHHALSSSILRLKGLRKDGKLEAIVGYCCQNGTMTSPFLGYDQENPDKKLYRLSSTLLFLEARKEKKLYNLSSGAGTYKKIRRAEGSWEYFAVYFHHLPLRRKLPWLLLNGAVNTFGIFVMKCVDSNPLEPYVKKAKDLFLGLATFLTQRAQRNAKSTKKTTESTS